MRFAVTSVLVLGITTTSVFADPTADAKFIVDATVTEEIMGAAFSTMRPMLVSSISHDLASRGIELSNPDRFFDIFVEEFQGEFMDALRLKMVDVYVQEFTEQQLADITHFYGTPSGLALLSKTPMLMQAGARYGQIAGQAAGRNAGPRVADRLEAEGIEMTSDKGLMQKLLDALRR